MTEEDAAIVRWGFDAYNRRDLDGLLETWAPDAVLDWSNSRGFDPGVYRGHDEIRAFWKRLLDAFEEVQVDIVDLQEIEDGLLVVDNVAHLRGREGIRVQARSAFVIARRGGMTTSLTLYQSKQLALEAVDPGV